jgi:hypothetical protein
MSRAVAIAPKPGNTIAGPVSTNFRMCLFDFTMETVRDVVNTIDSTMQPIGIFE